MVQIAQEFVVDNSEGEEDLETAIVYLRALGPTARPLLADALLSLHQIKRWNTHWKEQLASGEEAYRAARATDDEGRILDRGGGADRFPSEIIGLVRRMRCRSSPKR